MKILYDLRAYRFYNERGVGRHLYQLLKSVLKQTEQKLYILLDHDSPKLKLSKAERDKIVYCYLEDFQNGRYGKGEFDVYINTNAFLPFMSADSVINWQYPQSVLKASKKWTCMLYDYIPLFFQNAYLPTYDGKLSFAFQMEAVKYLDHIFTNSYFTLVSTVKYIDLDEERITCLYGGVNANDFRTPNTDRPYKESRRGNHVVYVSGAAIQKNNEGFARAFCRAYKEKMIPEKAVLYFLGQADENYIAHIGHEVESAGCKYGKQVIVTGYIPEKKMVELLGTARANMFPSYLEGLGLPILEGYAAGTPCFASGLTATREFVLKECTFDPFDEESMIDAIALAYRDDELCAQSLEFGRELLKEINWDNAARRLLDKCRELSGEMVGEG